MLGAVYKNFQLIAQPSQLDGAMLVEVP